MGNTAMGSAIWLNLTGLDELDSKTHSEVVVRLRHILEPLCKDASKTLTITKGNFRGDLNLDFDSETDTIAKDGCDSKLGNILGEEGGESVFVRAHQDLRVCGPIDSSTGSRDTRRILTASWLLGPALATTGLHELGHFIAQLEHFEDPMNIMNTGKSQPKLADRTLKTQREFWAANSTFNDNQKQKLIAQLKTGVFLGGMSIGP
jgi:hypothetical protein